MKIGIFQNKNIRQCFIYLHLFTEIDYMISDGFRF